MVDRRPMRFRPSSPGLPLTTFDPFQSTSAGHLSEESPFPSPSSRAPRVKSAGSRPSSARPPSPLPLSKDPEEPLCLDLRGTQALPSGSATARIPVRASGTPAESGETPRSGEIGDGTQSFRSASPERRQWALQQLQNQKGFTFNERTMYLAFPGPGTREEDLGPAVPGPDHAGEDEDGLGLGGEDEGHKGESGKGELFQELIVHPRRPLTPPQELSLADPTASLTTSTALEPSLQQSSTPEVDPEVLTALHFTVDRTDGTVFLPQHATAFLPRTTRGTTLMPSSADSSKKRKAEDSPAGNGTGTFVRRTLARPPSPDPLLRGGPSTSSPA
eukprot:RCo003554